MHYVRCGAYTASEHKRQVIPYHFLEEDYFEYECSDTLLLYICRYTMTSTIVVFMNCCSIESFKIYFRFLGGLYYTLLWVNI